MVIIEDMNIIDFIVMGDGYDIQFMVHGLWVYGFGFAYVFIFNLWFFVFWIYIYDFFVNVLWLQFLVNGCG